jgi:hypothetical protein
MHWNDAYTDVPVGAIPKKFVPRPIPTPPPSPGAAPGDLPVMAGALSSGGGGR